MLRTFFATLALSALFLACSKEPAGPPAQAASKPAAPAAPAQAAQDAPKPKPEPAPAPKPEPAPAADPTKPAPATPAATGGKEDQNGMYGPKNLTDAKNPKVNEKAPDVYKAKFETNEGSFVIEVTRAWSPNGADRVYNLVRNGFYDGVKFFRVVDKFMVQFGIHGDPKISAAWRSATIKDDPSAQQKNTRGMVTFAKAAAPNSRSTQLFINFGDNTFLDNQGFTPIGKVIEGMEVVDKLHKGYGETPSQAQMQIQMEGNAFLEKNFPELDHIVKASIVE